MPQTTGNPGIDTAPKPGRFVWPPIKVDPAAPSHVSIPVESGAESPPPPLLSPSPARPPTGPIALWWREVENTWLIPVSPPLDVRIQQLGWEPNPATEYCERCGSTIGTGESAAGSPEFGCSACRDVPLPWERFVRLGEYHAHLADWVQETKFSRCHWLGESLGRELARHIRGVGTLGAPDRTRKVSVVPVATSLRRRLARGIDHAACVARGVALELRCPLMLALRRSHRPTQRGLSPTAREANVAGAFRLRPGIDLSGQTVILVDDVRTTGATLREAARAIMGTSRRAGTRQQKAARPARLIVAVLAVTPDPSRKRSLVEPQP